MCKTKKCIVLVPEVNMLYILIYMIDIKISDEISYKEAKWREDDLHILDIVVQ